jgi:ornithine cyclodeaminase/alanine dehydrogenase-like protein (mu-crystallin family)
LPAIAASMAGQERARSEVPTMETRECLFRYPGGEMTADQALRLSAGQTLRALDEIDLPQLVAERLTAAGRGQVTPVLHAGPAGGWPPARPGIAETAVEDPGTGAVALLPTVTLRMIWAAGLACLASQVLVAPGVATAAVFGSAAALGLQVSVLARYLPALGHVTVPRTLPDRLAQGGPSVLAQLDLAGIGSATIGDPRRAALGANLLVLAASARGLPDIGPPAPGALVVNAAGRDLPGHVLERADRVYVDDLGLLAGNQHREFLHPPAAEPGKSGQPLLRNREGWYRRTEAGRRPRPIEADLVAVLDGSDPGRMNDEEILLAELLGTTVIDAALAWRLWQSAATRGLGSWVEQRSGNERIES